MKKTSIGNRMKENYENRYRMKLTRRTPVIIRLDGKAFHTLTRRCEKPFDIIFATFMHTTGLYLCEHIQGAKCAYIQSDEISILLIDFDKLTTEAWFDYNIQKIVSISAAMASAIFSSRFGHLAFFDSRAFNIPKDELCNYFIWRQKDWERNSIQMLAQAYFSTKQLHKKSGSDMHQMLHEKGANWANLDLLWKNGWFIWKTNEEWLQNAAPIFTQERQYIERYLYPNSTQGICGGDNMQSLEKTGISGAEGGT